MPTAFWVKINRGILLTKTLHSTRNLILNLEMEAGRPRPGAYLRQLTTSVARLQRITGLSERSVKYALDDCQDRGWIKWRQRRGKQLVLVLPDVGTDCVRSWRCLWYKSSWPFWQKDVFLTVQARWQPDKSLRTLRGLNLWVVDGKDHDGGLITLCHLRKFANSSYSEASRMLGRFREYLIERQLIKVVRSLTEDRPLGVRIMDDHLAILAKGIGNQWISIKKEGLFHAFFGATGADP